MATVHEILRQSGFTQEQIEALDAKAVIAFSTVLTTAETERTTATAAQAKAEADFKAAQEAVAKAEKERQDAIAAREQAELQHRSNVEFYEQKVVPGLTGWDEEKTQLQNERTRALAEAAFYRTQNEGARSGGFVPTDAPGYKAPEPEPNRDGEGRYVPGKGTTPGSPGWDADTMIKRAGDGFNMVSDLNWRHQQLFGSPLPIPPSQLIQEADAQKLDPRAYAEKRFGFSAREQELNATRQREHEAKIAAEAAAAKDAEWDAKMKAREAEYALKDKQRAEQTGNNPDVRTPAGSAKFAEVRKAVETGERPNPLKMTEAQRRAATRSAIHAEINEREGVGV